METDYCGDGERDQHVELSGSDYIQLPWGRGLGWAPPFTVEGWVFPIANTQPIWGSGNSSNGFALATSGSSQIKVVHYGAGYEAKDFSASASNMLYRWTYFALTVDVDSQNDALVKLYLDDTVAPSDSDGFQRSDYNDAYDSDSFYDLGLGKSLSGTNNWAGGMDDIRFWDRALSAEEVASSKARVLSTTDGLIASYSMDFSGDTLINDTGDALRNGTLQGSLNIGYSETCDDGNDITETECEYGTPTCVHCNADCTEELDLTGPYCGDSDTDADHEQCDDGNAADESECEYGTESCTACNADCSAELNLTGPYCGDGIPQPEHGEACDDGDENNANGCNNVCEVNPEDVCGDGYLDDTLYLDGNGDYVQFPSNQNLGWVPEFTIEGWVYPESSNSRSIWSTGNMGSGFALSTNDSNKQLQLDYCYPDGSMTDCIYLYSDTLPASATYTWVYFAATLQVANDPDRYYLRLYWDDTISPDLLDSSEEATGTELWSNDSTDSYPEAGYHHDKFAHVFDTIPYLGKAWTGTSSWQGQMDNIRFWSRALTPEELYAAKTGSLGTTTGLLADYGMTGSGTTLVNDLGNTDRNGMFMGNASWDTIEDCDDNNTNDGDGCSSSCTVEDGWECSGEPSTCGFATLTEGGESCVDAPPLLYVPGSSGLTATQYQVTADYGWSNNYDGYNTSISGCLDYQYGTDNFPPMDGEEVVFKITLQPEHYLYAELETGNNVSGSLYLWDTCGSSSEEPIFLLCSDEYTSVAENNGSKEELSRGHWGDEPRTYYLAVDAWCYSGSSSVTCPNNGNRDFTLTYYVVDYSD